MSRANYAHGTKTNNMARITSGSGFKMTRPTIKGTVLHKASIAKAKAEEKSIVTPQEVGAETSLVEGSYAHGLSNVGKAIDYSIENPELDVERRPRTKPEPRPEPEPDGVELSTLDSGATVEDMSRAALEGPTEEEQIAIDEAKGERITPEQEQGITIDPGPAPDSPDVDSEWKQDKAKSKWLYKENPDGSYTTKKSEGGKEINVKKGDAAYDAISGVFQENLQ